MQQQPLVTVRETENVQATSPTLMYARKMPTTKPRLWPGLLAAGAMASHVALGVALTLSYMRMTACELGDALALLCIVVLGPLGLVCSLAGIGLVRRHLNGWVFLASILALPLNVYFCLIPAGLVLFDIGL